MEQDPLIFNLKKPNVPATSVMRPAELRANSRPPLPLIGGLIAVILLLGAGWYIYGGAFFEAVQAPSDLSIAGLASSTRLVAPGVTVTMTEAELISRVAKLMELPANEQATIAIVSDLAPLKNQLFFRNARVGDVVLMYKKSMRAILYDPEVNKIVEVAPITFSDK